MECTKKERTFRQLLFFVKKSEFALKKNGNKKIDRDFHEYLQTFQWIKKERIYSF